MPSIGSLVAYLRLDDAQYQRALRSSEHRTLAASKAMGAALAGVAARFAAPAALTGFAVKLGGDVLRTADSVKTLAQQAGVTNRELQVLDFVARQNSATAADWVPVLERVRNTLDEAAAGSASARADFKALGLDWRELARTPLPVVIEQIARAQLAGERTHGAYAAAVDVLGAKSLPRLRASLQQLADVGYPAAEKATVRAGQIIDDQFIAKMDEARTLGGNLWHALVVGSANTVTAIARNMEQIGRAIGEPLDKAINASAQRTVDLRNVIPEAVSKFAAEEAAKRFGDDYAKALNSELDRVTRELLARGTAQFGQTSTGFKFFIDRTTLRADIDAAMAALQRLRGERAIEVPVAVEKGSLNEFRAALAEIAIGATEDFEKFKAAAGEGAEKVHAIFAAGRAEAFLAALPPLEKIAELERRIAEYRLQAADAFKTPDARAEAARAVLAAEEKIRDLKLEQLQIELSRSFGEIDAASITALNVELVRTGSILADSVLTPLEEYQRRVAEVEKAFRAGALDPDPRRAAELRTRLLQKAVEDLNETKLDALRGQFAGLAGAISAAGDRLAEMQSVSSRLVQLDAGGSNETLAKRIQKELSRAETSAARGDTRQAERALAAAEKLYSRLNAPSLEQIAAKVSTKELEADKLKVAEIEARGITAFGSAAAAPPAGAAVSPAASGYTGGVIRSNAQAQAALAEYNASRGFGAPPPIIRSNAEAIARTNGPTVSKPSLGAQAASVADEGGGLAGGISVSKPSLGAQAASVADEGGGMAEGISGDAAAIVQEIRAFIKMIDEKLKVA